jgi:uncharacterized protein YidB (DUF937 family)
MVNDPNSSGLRRPALESRKAGRHRDSWVSTGKNLPISADQIQQALGSGQLGAIAEKLGMSQGDASAKLAELLPDVVDKLTPNGQIPDAGGLGDLLGSLTKRLG